MTLVVTPTIRNLVLRNDREVDAGDPLDQATATVDRQRRLAMSRGDQNTPGRSTTPIGLPGQSDRRASQQHPSPALTTTGSR